MIKLDETKIYDLSELTSEERNELRKYLKQNFNNWDNETGFYKNYCLYFADYDNTWYQGERESTHNAKELFYTLENIQVDCRYLTYEQIENVFTIFSKNYEVLKTSRVDWSDEVIRISKSEPYTVDFFEVDESKTTIAYEKFMELFTNLIEVLNEELEESRNEDYYYVFSDDSKELSKANSIGEGVNIRLELTPEGVVKFLADKDVFLSPEDYKKLFE